MESIGERAAHAIKERCVEKRCKLYEELDVLGIANHSSFNGWENGKYDPTAHYLQNMALAGYDTFWILTGRKQDGK